MELDKEILGELNRRTHRYTYFKIFRVKPDNLKQLKQSDLNWIERVCESEGYNSEQYLDYYNKRTTK